jgi:mannitol-specific phosphotransferase system IIBC component
MAGPQAALFAETFTARLRFTGSSVGYQLAAVTAGGPASIIATSLLSTFHTSTAVAAYVIAAAAVSFVATLQVRLRQGQDLSVEHDAAPAAPRPGRSSSSSRR